MGRIFCLMGKSSTGKDTIFKKLMERDDINLGKIIPYTTRPIREGEKDGVEYHFSNEKGYQILKAGGKVIEDRSYETYHGLWRYFTVDDGQIDIRNKNYCFIGTLEAFEKMKSYYGPGKIVPIMIDLDDGTRLQRALDREKRPENHRYSEMCRRFLADNVDFSEDKMERAGITRTFINEDLETCVNEIAAFIKANL